MKQCSKCNETKSLDEFHKNAARADGVCTYCSSCESRMKSEDPNKLEKGRAKAKRNESQRRNYDMTRAYGLTLVQYDKMLTSQNGVCRMCGTPPRKKRLNVDHDHDTGRVRGLLCDNCNTGLGNLRDDVSLLQAGLDYLRSDYDGRKL